MRISREEYLMREAWNASLRSSCLRLQVGAILSRDGRVVVTGYNGSLSGLDHCTPLTCNPTTPCTATVHAEVNCVYFAARLGISTHGTFMYTTDSPCRKCAEAIIQSGVSVVIYDREYRDTEPLGLLRYAGIVVDRLEIFDAKGR